MNENEITQNRRKNLKDVEIFFEFIIGRDCEHPHIALEFNKPDVPNAVAFIKMLDVVKMELFEKYPFLKEISDDFNFDSIEAYTVENFDDKEKAKVKVDKNVANKFKEWGC